MLIVNKYQSYANYAVGLVLMIFIFSPSFSQTPIFTNHQKFSVEDGLPQSFISGITQDKNGFIWLATLDGLARFDGRQFKRFHYKPGQSDGLSSNAIVNMYSFGNNQISILYDGYKNDLLDLQTLQVSHQNIPEILRKISGISWAVTTTENIFNGKTWLFVQKGNKGIGWYDIRNNEIIYASTSNGILANDTVYALLQTLQGKTYLINENGVQVSDTGKSTFTWIPMYTGIKAHNTFGEAEDYYGGNWVSELPNDRLAVTDYDTLVILDLKYKKRITYDLREPMHLNPKQIPILTKTDKHQQLYFAHGGKVYRLQNDGQLKILWQNNIAPSLEITSCFIDRTDALWVSVNAQGLVKVDLKAKPFQSYLYKSNFFVDILRQSGIPESKMPSEWPKEPDSYFFRYVYDSKGNLFYSFNPKRNSGIFYLENSIEKELPGSKGKRQVFTALTVDAKDGLWAFDLEKGGWYYWKNKNSEPVFYPPLRNSLTGIFSADALFAGGKLWMTTYYQGLLEYENQKLKNQFAGKYQGGNLSGELTEMCADPINKDNFWIGSRGGGLILFNAYKGVQRVFTTDDGLPNNTIYCIVTDQFKNLWCSSNMGIFRFNPVTHQVTRFEKPDGLPGNEFNRAHKFKFPDGKIAFGGVEGFTIFDPKNFENQQKADAVPIEITAIEINNSALSFPLEQKGVHVALNELRLLELPYDKNYLRIEFAAMQFNQPGKIRYRYQLKGADKVWVNAGTNNIAVYSALSPGKYQFMVNATDYDGRWSNDIKELTIEIHPPFWATTWAYILYGLILLALFRWYIVYKENQNRIKHRLVLEHKDALRLREMDEVKDRFFSNITHEFRTPLTLIITPLEKLLHEGTVPEYLTETLYSIKNNSGRLLKLINQFLDFSKLNDGHMKINLSMGELSLFVKNQVDSFSPAAIEKNISLISHIQNKGEFYLFDEDKWEKIIANLLSNAIKFTPDGGTIDVNFEINEQTASLEVHDTGKGIPLTEQSKIFERFYQVDSLSTREFMGTGIGLSLVKEMADILQGSIALKSAPGEGATFTIQIPVQKINKIELGSSTVSKSTNVPAVEPGQASAPLLLIAEDNEELRSFLEKSLNEKYRVVTASNGLKAKNLMFEDLPDIIISDVMMPELDGMELCKFCKQDNRTSHIGFILLTSRASPQERVKGLEYGADYYITKPFLLHELELKISNHLYYRQQIRMALKKKLLSPQPPTEMPRAEDPFLKELFEVVNNHLDDPKMGVDFLCNSFAMSRSTLNRKLKSLLNISPNDLIRQYRLQKAALALSSGIDITTVCYQVGFSSPSYFTQCFKEQYGITPSQYLSEKLNQN